MSRAFGVGDTVVREVLARVVVENIASNRRFRPCLGCLVSGGTEDGSVFSAYKAEDLGPNEAIGVVVVKARSEFVCVNEDFPVYPPLLGAYLILDLHRAEICPNGLVSLDKLRETLEIPVDLFLWPFHCHPILYAIAGRKPSFSMMFSPMASISNGPSSKCSDGSSL